MSFISITDADDVVRKVDVIPRTEGPDTVEVQAIALINPVTGDTLLPESGGGLPLSPGAATAAAQATGNAAAQATVDALGEDGPTPPTITGTGMRGWLRALYERIGADAGTALTAIADAIQATDTPFANGDKGMLVLGKRRDSDTTSVSNDGDYTTFNMDEFGRMKVAAAPAGYALVQGDIAAAAGQVAINVSSVSNLMLQMFVPSAVAGHNCIFEGSLNSTNGVDGNWITLQAARTNANTVETATGALSATPAYGWEISVNGMNWARVRATAHTSGSARWLLQAAPYATEPIPIAQITGTQPVSFTQPALVAGTARVGFVAGAGIWYDDSTTVLAASATFTGTSRDATVTATATAFGNAGTYAEEIRTSAESDQSGTLFLEVSRDNTTWRRIKTAPTVAVTGGGQYAEIIHSPSWRYWRTGFVNGATLQTRFTINSMATGA
jgi:hypothetical protein